MKSVLIASVLVAASAAFASPAAAAPNAAASAPINKDGVEISILPQVGSGGGPANVTEIALDLEAKTADAAARLGFQSLRAVADIDCSRSSNRFISAVAYQQPALAGRGLPRNITGAWVQPSADSYMAVVIERVCAAQAAAQAAPAAPVTPAARKAPAPPAPLPVVKEMAAPPPPAPAPAPVTQAAAAPPLPEPAPPVAPAAAPTPPTPSPPQVIKFDSAGRPVTPPAAAAALPPPKPAPAPAAAPAPAPPPPSGPLVVKFSGAGAPASAPPASASPASAAPPKRAGDRIAQVAASGSVQDAEKVLRELKPLISPPLTTTIEQAVVGGAHVYRADVVGFETAADAKAFCESAARWSKTCWVRAKSDAPAKVTPVKPANAAAKPAERLRPARRAG